MDTIIIDKISYTSQLVLQTPKGPKPIVQITTDHAKKIQMARPVADDLAAWIETQLNAGIEHKIKAGLLKPAELSRVCETDEGRVILQFSPNAAKQYVGQMRHW